MLRTTTIITGPPGSPYYSTLYFEGLLQAEATAAANATRTFWDSLGAVMSNTAAMNVQDEVEVVDVATGQTVGTFQAPTATANGIVAGDILPPATQGLIRWLTGVYVNGRQLRGRTFVPAMTETQNVSGAPSGGTVSTIATAAQTLMGTSDLGVYSPTHGQFALGTTATVWGQFAQLRSRRD